MLCSEVLISFLIPRCLSAARYPWAWKGSQQKHILCGEAAGSSFSPNLSFPSSLVMNVCICTLSSAVHHSSQLWFQSDLCTKWNREDEMRGLDGNCSLAICACCAPLKDKSKNVSRRYLGVQLPTHVETIRRDLRFNPQLGHIFISH